MYDRCGRFTRGRFHVRVLSLSAHANQYAHQRKRRTPDETRCGETRACDGALTDATLATGYGEDLGDVGDGAVSWRATIGGARLWSQRGRVRGRHVRAQGRLRGHGKRTWHAGGGGKHVCISAAISYITTVGSRQYNRRIFQNPAASNPLLP